MTKKMTIAAFAAIATLAGGVPAEAARLTANILPIPGQMDDQADPTMACYRLNNGEQGAIVYLRGQNDGSRMGVVVPFDAEHAFFNGAMQAQRGMHLYNYGAKYYAVDANGSTDMGRPYPPNEQQILAAADSMQYALQYCRQNGPR